MCSYVPNSQLLSDYEGSGGYSPRVLITSTNSETGVGTELATNSETGITWEEESSHNLP